MKSLTVLRQYIDSKEGLDVVSDYPTFTDQDVAKRIAEDLQQLDDNDKYMLVRACFLHQQSGDVHFDDNSLIGMFDSIEPQKQGDLLPHLFGILDDQQAGVIHFKDNPLHPLSTEIDLISVLQINPEKILPILDKSDVEQLIEQTKNDKLLSDLIKMTFYRDTYLETEDRLIAETNNISISNSQKSKQKDLLNIDEQLKQSEKLKDLMDFELDYSHYNNQVELDFNDKSTPSVSDKKDNDNINRPKFKI